MNCNSTLRMLQYSENWRVDNILLRREMSASVSRLCEKCKKTRELNVLSKLCSYLPGEVDAFERGWMAYEQ